MLAKIIGLCAVVLVLGTGSALAQTRYNDPQTAEGWAWQQIRNDAVADLADRTPPGSAAPCGPLDLETPAPNNDCHVISAQFLVDALTDPKLRAQVGRHGFRLVNAQLGTLDLSDARVPFALWIKASRIDGDLDLDDSQFEKLLLFEGTKIAGDFQAERAKFDNSLFLRSKATIDGNVDLSAATVGGTLEMGGSSFAGRVSLNSAEIKGNLFLNDEATFGGGLDLTAATVGGELEMDGSSFAGRVSLNGAEIKGLLLLRKATFGGDVDFRDATVGNNLEMDGVSFAGNVDLGTAQIKGALFLRDEATFRGEVNLVGATVGSNLEMTGSSFAGRVTLNRAEIKGSLFLNGKATFGGDVDLGSAAVGSALEMIGSSFAGPVNLNSAEIKGSLFLNGKATFGGDVDLTGATVGGDLPMDGSSFAGGVGLNHAEIKGSLFLNGKATFRGDVDLGSAMIGSNLEMEGSSFAGRVSLNRAEIKRTLFLIDATVTDIDLSGAEIGELDLPHLGWRCPGPEPQAAATAKDEKAGPQAPPMHWSLDDPGGRSAPCGAAAPSFDLRNAHVGAFQDSPDAWPPVIHLEGFHYDRLGSAGGGDENEMHRRAPREWTDWIERDPVFSAQPYTQLSSVLLAAGDRGKAEAIQFAGREAERHHESDWLTWAWLTVLAGVAGYGIGLYTFFVLGWVLLLTAVGAVLLWLSPQARAHRFVWRLGASLHRVLPVIELSKDYTDFFDGLSQEPIIPLWRKHLLQMYFAGHAIAGYVLGFFLIAAMGGLTQKG
jgi:hypothetical protein